MAKRPGHVDVITEVGYCNFCGRPRNLRREEHRLGALVRTIVTCETCHRTLTTSMGVATEEPEREAVATVDAKPAAEKKARPAAKAAAKAPTKKAAAAKPKAAPKAAVKARPKPAAKAAAKSKPSTSRRTGR